MNNPKKHKVKNKGNKKRKVKKTPIIVLCVILIFFTFIGISSYKFYSLYQKGGIKHSSGYTVPHYVTVSIKMGTSPKEIMSVLKESEIIDNSFLFYLKAKNDGVIESFKAGDFTFNTDMDYNQIIDTLQNPNKDTQLKLLVKEGQTQEDIAKTLDEKGIVSYKDFMNACNNINFDYDFLKGLQNNPERKNKLEGYLYPDTYYLSENETAETIINKLLSRFDELYTEDMAKKASDMGFTTDEIITIASIVEREVKYSPEKNIVASVVYNRLKKSIKLQMDSTVLYAKNKHSDRTLISDTKIESPYNTYYVEGLPIGPISNPSIDTIKAVLNPANTDYLYYVVKDDTTGKHFFTSNYNEFLKAKDEYVKKFD
ncbi:endolytic transglycosylase MltG [[Clostridium] colinum]|uniref:endolytic transglycosylase MltG n=1 Tax=[Clostridium] colinum TaxID=36835 RepID=UPI002024F6F1|nr:endolytic transglycosylase MltG [[Clostridium] colinum]